MSTLDELIARRSVRAYTDEPISAADERAIISAAYEAPTAGNQQLYSLVAIRDQALKERLAVLCDNQPFIAKAKLVLIFLADLSRWQDAYIAEGLDVREPGLGDVMLSVVDTAIAAQNSVVAAWSLGIGSCYIGDILENYEEFVEILDLPAETRGLKREAKAVDVAGGVGELLRRNVSRRTDARGRVRFIDEKPRIGKNGLSFDVQHIPGFYVTMQKMVTLKRGKSLRK